MNWLVRELAGAEFGDIRLTGRMMRLVEKLSERPGASVPEACGDMAAAKAAYRFWKNEAVSVERILESHVQETASRASEHSVVLVAQDTTEINLTGHQRNNRPGLFGLDRVPRIDDAQSPGHFAGRNAAGRPARTFLDTATGREGQTEDPQQEENRREREPTLAGRRNRGGSRLAGTSASGRGRRSRVGPLRPVCHAPPQPNGPVGANTGSATPRGTSGEASRRRDRREPGADDARMLELLEPYRGHRWRVIRLLWANGVHAPRRGPRRARRFT